MYRAREKTSQTTPNRTANTIARQLSLQEELELVQRRLAKTYGLGPLGEPVGANLRGTGCGCTIQ